MVDKSKEAKVAPADEPCNRPGYKAYKVLGSRFELPDSYEVIDPVGSGAYGVVVAAKDTQEADENNMVAIKKIDKAFEHKVFALRTLRELKIMRLMDHENVLSIKTILKPETPESFD